MVLYWRYPTRTKIVIDDSHIDKVANFKYLGCGVTYELDHDINSKIKTFQDIYKKICRKLERKRRQTRSSDFTPL
jgi:hypothetical protein